jgi:hypothetical protein
LQPGQRLPIEDEMNDWDYAFDAAWFIIFCYLTVEIFFWWAQFY